jgi:hypothetical protein
LVTGFFWNGSIWTETSLYGRDEDPDDHGLGVCSPSDQTSGNCSVSSGGGDWNELDNSGQAELMRLALGSDYQWITVGLSSLDTNDGGGPERGVLWADNDDDPNNGLGTIIWSFQGDTSPNPDFEPDFDIPALYANSYLFFQPIDWATPTLNTVQTFGSYHHKKNPPPPPQPSTNNDFLVRAAVVDQPNRVPEPSSMVLLLAGLAALGVRFQKRRR